MSEGDDAVEVVAGDGPPSRWSRLVSGLRRPWRHPWISGAALVVVVAGGYGAVQLKDWVDPPFQTTSYDVPTAPRLTPRAGETVYRIDPTRSQAGYTIDEQIVGRTASTATGTTQGIAGDVALDPSRPAAVRVGEIVIDVEQLHSDSTLRDARLRSDFLESHDYPLARFRTTSIEGLPASASDGARADVRITGDLTVKGTTRKVTWSGTARLSGDELRLDASTKVKLSEFGVGPISIIGLLSTSDEARLDLRIVAADPTTQDIPTEIADPTREPATGGPSFARAVEPILEENCVGCHRSGEIGADVWRLDTAGDAADVAGGIATVTASRYMPPWPPSTKGVPVQHARGLTTGEIATLASWAQHGGRLDVASGHRLQEHSTKEPNPPRADVVLKMSQMYAGDGTETNDYRCFLLDPHFTQPTYVTGSEFTPGNRKIVHHALIYRTPATELPSIEPV